jgi:uncharacterized protein YcnI
MLVLLTFAALLLAPAAFAHFAFVPGEVPARSFARLQISVPNEEPNASTVRVALQIPESVVFVRVPPTQGWTVNVEREPLDEPLLVGNRRVDDRISVVEWSGGEIAGTDSQSFAIRLAVPRGAGETLAFPATQTYSDDQVVQWVGPSDSDNPAPVLAVTPFDPAAESLPIRRAPQEAPPPAPTTTETTNEPDAEEEEEEAAEAAPASADDDDGGVSAPLLVALAVGLAGVLVLTGWLLARRRRAS